MLERIQFATYESLVDQNSPLVTLFPNIHFGSFRTFHYLQSMSHFFGFVFYSFYLLLFMVHGKTFLTFEYSFLLIYILQIFTFGCSLITQKISFHSMTTEYLTYDTFAFFPKSVIEFCDGIVVAQFPMYWFVITSFLIIQIAEFTNQNIRALKFAHVYLIPVFLIVFLISRNTPEHMEVVMTVVCFLIWWIYRKHMVARLYTQDTSRKDNLNLRRLNIWLSLQIFVSLLYHLLRLGVTILIKSMMTDVGVGAGRQTYYMFWKDTMFEGATMLGTYLNAVMFAWSTIYFIKSDGTENKSEQSTLPVIIGASMQMENLSRRPSTISMFSQNNVAPLTPRDPNMLHI